ncbi:MAG: YHYH protein [Verrucomicrobiota bacterium]
MSISKFTGLGLLGGILTWAALAQPGNRRSNASPVELPESSVSIEIEGDYRVINANGIPNHDHANFPRRGNPHAILPQTHRFKVPLKPEVAEKITPLLRQPFGVALNGVPMDPGTAEYWNQDRNSGWRYEAISGKINLGLDDNHAHVQPSGAYHYHGLPVGLVELYSKDESMTIIGYAADGFPVYSQFGYRDPKDMESELIEVKSSFRIKEGTRSGGAGGKYDGTFVQDYEYVEALGDLDECNGRFGPTPEHPEGVYHYYITLDYPFIPRAFRGTPDESFERQRNRGGDAIRRGGGGRRDEERRRPSAEVEHGHAH